MEPSCLQCQEQWTTSRPSSVMVSSTTSNSITVCEFRMASSNSLARSSRTSYSQTSAADIPEKCVILVQGSLAMFCIRFEPFHKLFVGDDPIGEINVEFRSRIDLRFVSVGVKTLGEYDAIGHARLNGLHPKVFRPCSV